MIAFLIVILTVCVATNSSEGVLILSPGGEMLTESAIGIDHFLGNPIERLTSDAPVSSLAEKVLQTPPLLDKQTFIDLYEIVSELIENRRTEHPWLDITARYA
jgi:hypothetical protein